jgi:hypothetical protein
MSGFIEFLNQQNILNISLATMIGFYLNDFTTNISQIIITPIISLFSNVDNVENFYVKIFKFKFMLGKLLLLILRFIITLIIIYYIYVIITKITKAKQDLVDISEDIDQDIRKF